VRTGAKPRYGPHLLVAHTMDGSMWCKLVLRMQLDGLHREIGGFWRRSRIPKWRAVHGAKAGGKPFKVLGVYVVKAGEPLAKPAP
jgi:hypothetical protein